MENPLVVLLLLNIGRLPPKINKYLMAYQKKTDSLKLPTLKNPTFTFDLTQIQVVSFQCNHIFFNLKPQGHQIWAE
jgi:hypothetical protein